MAEFSPKEVIDRLAEYTLDQVFMLMVLEGFSYEAASSRYFADLCEESQRADG